MILVTGGTGFLGSHLLLQLAQNPEKIRAVYRKKDSLQTVEHIFSYYFHEAKAKHLFQKIEWFQADLLDVPALETAFLDIKRVFHCAAMVSFHNSEQKLLRKTNIEGTANLVNLCILNCVEKLVYVSSIATFDAKRGQKILDETSLWDKERPHSMYAITKYGAEMEVWRATQEGVPCIIVNPGIILGPGFWNSGSGLLFQKIEQGFPFYALKKTGFVGVRDVAKILILLMKKQVENQEYILISENISMKTVLEEIAIILEKPAPKRPFRVWMLKLGYTFQKYFGWLLHTRWQVDRQVIRNLNKSSCYSNEKIKKELDFQFEPITSVIAETGTLFMQDLK